MCECGSERLIAVHAKCNDMASVVFKSGEDRVESDGYVPRGIGIGGGDYIKLTICADCGRVQGWKDLEDQDIIEALNGC